MNHQVQVNHAQRASWVALLSISQPLLMLGMVFFLASWFSAPAQRWLALLLLLPQAYAGLRAWLDYALLQSWVALPESLREPTIAPLMAQLFGTQAKPQRTQVQSLPYAREHGARRWLLLQIFFTLLQAMLLLGSLILSLFPLPLP